MKVITKKSTLKYAFSKDFKQIKWIGGAINPSSYIDSGYTCGSIDGFELKFSADIADFNTSSSSGQVFTVGSLFFADGIGRVSIVLSSNQTSVFLGSGEYYGGGCVTTDGVTHIVSVKNNEVYIDGEKKHELKNTPSIYQYSSFYLNCAYAYPDAVVNTLSDDNSSGVKIENIKLFNGSNVVAEFIPIKRTDNGKVCFYDKVGKTFKYTNDDSTPKYGE